ncbi:hypothetical protein [Capnocytophaga canis]|uniref:hypothetical protein n=1 Tax=Capnocytophaga canis TaxID=1848903 RepID=UPI0037D87195
MEQTFEQAFTRLNKHKQTTSIGTVTKVDGDVCEVEREGLPPLLDVRLNAIQTEVENPFWIVPKVGSKVLCLEIENQPAETCIVKYTEIERVEINIGGAILKVENGKIQFKNDTADLKLLLTELLAELKTAIIQTPSGVGNFAPNNVIKFSELESKTKQLFE